MFVIVIEVDAFRFQPDIIDGEPSVALSDSEDRAVKIVESRIQWYTMFRIRTIIDFDHEGQIGINLDYDLICVFVIAFCDKTLIVRTGNGFVASIWSCGKRDTVDQLCRI